MVRKTLLVLTLAFVVLACTQAETSLTIDTDYNNDVFIDNSFVGRGTTTVVLEPGLYTYTVKSGGKITHSAQTSLERGERHIQKVSLADQLSVPTGGFAITSNVNKAEVYIDGNLAGFTPLNASPFSYEYHNITVRKEGYRDASISSLAYPHDTRQLHLELVSE